LLYIDEADNGYYEYRNGSVGFETRTNTLFFNNRDFFKRTLYVHAKTMVMELFKPVYVEICSSTFSIVNATSHP